MLIAEIHGKALEAARDDEDYLTSAVFGELRFVAPGPFWRQLFLRARGMTSDTSSLAESATRTFDGASRLQVWFWPSFPKYGQPDLVLRFSGGSRPALLVVVEVKLHSLKGGVDENDQLARYLKLLDDWQSPDIPTAADDERRLLYLTPRESSGEIQQSLATLANGEQMRRKAFRLQWQDVLEAARSTASAEPEPAATVLQEVAEFLRRRNLEYFRGFRADLRLVTAVHEGRFYSATVADRTASPTCAGLRRLETLKFFSIQRGDWIP